MNKKVAIVGSGFAAWGATIALVDSADLELHIFDIGRTGPEGEGANRPVANAKKYLNSYFCYGINDSHNPVKIDTARMCSSHALGGHSTVYSGAILYPLDADLKDWPADAKPTAHDYSSVLKLLPIIYEKDLLETVFPVVPQQSDLSRKPTNSKAASVVGMSRIAATQNESSSDSPVVPFWVGGEFLKYQSAGKLRYTSNSYVLRVENIQEGVKITLLQKGKIISDIFDAVFIGAGCVNTTTIIDQSLGLPGARDYLIRAPQGSLHAFWRFSRKVSTGSMLRKKNELPELFLEVRAPGTSNAWSHTQLTSINEQIIQEVCSRLPRFLHSLVKAFSHVIYFASSLQTAEFNESGVLRSIIDLDAPEGLQQNVEITEYPVKRNVGLVSAVRRAVLQNWSTLRMFPIPFGELLADFFRGNRLGGWHFGGTLPMSEQPTRFDQCWTTGEVHRLKSVYVLDSSAFPTVPPSTVALLTAAHAHRVARCWKAKYLLNEVNQCP